MTQRDRYYVGKSPRGRYGLISVSFITVLFLALGIVVLLWLWYESSGKVTTVTSLNAPQLTDEVINHFVPDGWELESSSGGTVTLQRGPSLLLGLLLLPLVPLGFLYLFTDWGQGSLTVSFRETGEGARKVHLSWSSTPVRGQVRQFLEWLQDIDGDAVLKVSA